MASLLIPVELRYCCLRKMAVKHPLTRPGSDSASPLLFYNKADEANDVLSQRTSGEARKTLEPLSARASISPQSPSSLLSTRKKLLDRVSRYRTVLYVNLPVA